MGAVRVETRHAGAETASRAIYEGVLESTAAEVRTADLQGHSTTTEFTDEVISRVGTKLEAWESLPAGSSP